MANGTVYRRDDRKKPWIAHVSWHEGDRRRQSKRSYSTKKEAQAALAETIDAHRRQDFVAPTALRVRDFVETWINALETQGRKVSTIAGYRRTMKLYVLPRLGSRKLQDLRATDLDDLYAELLRSGGVKGRPLSMSTVHHVHTAIGKLLHDAERKGLVVRNVARLADAPSMAAARDRAPDMNVWTPDELSRFLRYAENYRAGALVHLAAMTGMRRGELVALRWDAVDLRRSTVKVRAAATYLGGVETIDVPKTKRSRRTIDLDQRTVSEMKRHRATQREELFELGVTSPTDDRVFANEIGEPMRPHSVGQAFNRLVESSGIPRIRLHDLRHTHASHLLAAGVNAKVVSERLGHASVSFTLDTYGHVMPGQQSEAAEAAAALLSW
jgi:integrase